MTINSKLRRGFTAALVATVATTSFGQNAVAAEQDGTPSDKELVAAYEKAQNLVSENNIKFNDTTLSEEERAEAAQEALFANVASITILGHLNERNIEIPEAETVEFAADATATDTGKETSGTGKETDANDTNTADSTAANSSITQGKKVGEYVKTENGTRMCVATEGVPDSVKKSLNTEQLKTLLLISALIGGGGALLNNPEIQKTIHQINKQIEAQWGSIQKQIQGASGGIKNAIDDFVKKNFPQFGDIGSDITRNIQNMINGSGEIKMPQISLDQGALQAAYDSLMSGAKNIPPEAVGLVVGLPLAIKFLPGIFDGIFKEVNVDGADGSLKPCDTPRETDDSTPTPGTPGESSSSKTNNDTSTGTNTSTETSNNKEVRKRETSREESSKKASSKGAKCIEGKDGYSLITNDDGSTMERYDASCRTADAPAPAPSENTAPAPAVAPVAAAGAARYGAKINTGGSVENPFKVFADLF